MNFKPKTENEIREQMLWPKGEYDFECVQAEKATSGQNSKLPGTEYIKLSLRLFNATGATRFQQGILHPAMEAQLRHFCAAGGIIEKYETGTLAPEDCVGVSGRLKLKIKEAEGNYPAKNEVADYVVSKSGTAEKATAATTAAPQPPEDDVPF